MLTQGAIVLLITDGLERDPDDRLGFEIDRLHRSCRRLIWLNPLLRFSGFEAKAKGIRTIVPHVDELRPIHNLESMQDLVRALSASRGRGGEGRDQAARSLRRSGQDAAARAVSPWPYRRYPPHLARKPESGRRRD